MLGKGRAAAGFGECDFQILRASARQFGLMTRTHIPEKAMTRKKLLFVLAATTALGALALSAARAHDVPKVATGFIANVLCSETFVSGLEPDRILAETTAAMPGAGLITWAMDYTVDRARKDVTVT